MVHAVCSIAAASDSPLPPDDGVRPLGRLFHALSEWYAVNSGSKKNHPLLPTKRRKEKPGYFPLYTCNVCCPRKGILHKMSLQNAIKTDIGCRRRPRCCQRNTHPNPLPNKWQGCLLTGTIFFGPVCVHLLRHFLAFSHSTLIGTIFWGPGMPTYLGTAHLLGEGGLSTYIWLYE